MFELNTVTLGNRGMGTRLIRHVGPGPVTVAYQSTKPSGLPTDIFSGTGSVGSVFAAEFGWKLFSIDNDKRQAKRCNAMCQDMLTFDFKK
jgi:hypothetical protein